MWCCVQGFTFCSNDLVLQALCKNLKIFCYWLQTSRLLLFPNQCVDETNDPDKWSETLWLGWICVSHKQDGLTNPSAVLGSGRLWLSLWEMWIGEVKQVSEKYFIYCIVQAERWGFYCSCVCVCTTGSSIAVQLINGRHQRRAPTFGSTCCLLLR